VHFGAVPVRSKLSRPSLRSVLTVLPLALVAGCGSDPEPAKPAARLLVDANRDGALSEADAALDRATWSAASGAVMLANIDDDAARCPKAAASDDELAACNDAADEVVNGDDDALDLAPMRIVPSAIPADATFEVVAVGAGAGRVRLFAKTDGAFGTGTTGALTLSAREVGEGLDLGVEAIDIVRDRDAWDGFVEVTLTAKSAAGEALATDAVRLRVSPVFLSHHLSPAERVFASRLPPSFDDGTSAAFNADLSRAAQSAAVSGGFTPITAEDQWNQDYLETAFATMPGPGGVQHAMRVYIRSANYNFTSSGRVNPRFPLRVAGRSVFSVFRGKDVAGLQQYDKGLAKSFDNDTYDSFGNTETIPPHSFGGKSWPLGRVVRGSSATDFPERSFTKLLESQGYQDPVYVDTSWLLVGHIDETTSYVKAPGALGWKLLLSDTALGKKLLEDSAAAGSGAAKMFVGKQWYDWEGNPTPAETTVAAVLADQDIMAMSATAAVREQRQFEQIASATGITEADVLRVPAVDQPVEGKALAYVPGMVNGIYLADGVYGAPETHGPRVGGVDPFKVALEQALATVGVRVIWIEDWDLFHAAAGEVHCGSNTQRAIPAFKWWEQAR
jgi:protein-arginine deiminase